MAAPDMCDGTSAVGESRHRIPRRIRWSNDRTLLSHHRLFPCPGRRQRRPALGPPPSAGGQCRHPRLQSGPGRELRRRLKNPPPTAVTYTARVNQSGRPSLPAHTLRKLNRSPATLNDYQSKVDCHFPRLGLPASAHVHWSVIMIEPEQSDIGRSLLSNS